MSSRIISIRLNENIIERIRAYCRDNGISLEEVGLSSIVRGIIANYLKEKGYLPNLQSNQAMKQNQKNRGVLS